MGFLQNIMISALDAIYGYVGNWGFTIIILTIIIRLIILPLGIVQGKSTRKIAQIKPEEDKIRKKYKDDPERLQLELMDLYRRNKINPSTSCLGLFFQLPFFIGMIRALDAHAVLKEATFLGFVLGQSVSQSTPLVKVILPVIAMLTMYTSMKLSPSMGAGQEQANSQKYMVYFMMAFMGYISYSYSAAFSLYIITGNLVSLLERLFVPKGELAGEGDSVK
jgi:YidC/Oxa1 family membrane protein insertase